MDLAKQVRDYFQNLYGTKTDDLSPGSLFLAFEQFGREVRPSDFESPEGGPSPNPNLVLAYGSHLVDFFAELDSDGFIQPKTDLSPSVSGGYDALLRAAKPEPGPDPLGFLELQGQARTEFDRQKGSWDGDDMWPAKLAPQLWFDDKDAAAWQSYKYTDKPSEPPKPLDAGAVGRIPIGAWKWRRVTPQTAPIWAAAAKVQALHASDPVLGDLHARKITAVDPVTRRAHIAAVAPVIVARPVVPVARMARLGAFAVGRATIQPPAAAPAPAPAPAPADGALPIRAKAMPFNPGLVRSVVLASALQHLDTAPVTSSDFEMSFDYRVVDISRPWISPEFLSAAHWYAAGERSGFRSAGAYGKDAGPLTYLPAKFIVTKNLKITANWSSEDRALAAGNGVSIGPFSLINKEFTNNTLCDPGMRIIAWLCQVTPVLPPISDPALAPPVPAGG